MLLRWVTVKTASELTSYAPETIRRWARRGEIEARKASSGPNGVRVRVELEHSDDDSGFLRDAAPTTKKR